MFLSLVSPASGIVCLTPVSHVPCVGFNKKNILLVSSLPEKCYTVDMDENKESLYITYVSHINTMHIKMTFIMNI